MKLFYVNNLTEQTAHCEVAPWDFKQTEEIPAQVRQDKKARQDFYHNTSTHHQFYTGFEGWNPNQRVSQKDNPPRLLHAICVDYDTVFSQEAVDRGIERMAIKPTWVETSLGGGLHAVWLLSEPLAVGDYDFSVFLMGRMVKWLDLGLLPCLDEPMLKDPVRLLCNGGAWRKTGEPIPENAARAFFMECGQSYHYRPANRVNIPLADVEKELRAKYPRLESWEGAFDYEAMGPSFWVEGSVSPRSAIVKTEGLFTFAAHAAKPFYSWKDLLGAEFVEKYMVEIMGSATKGVYFDGVKFWKYNPALFKMCDIDAASLQRDLRVEKKLSGKPDNDGTGSPLEKALNYIQNYNRVDSALPVLFRPAGVIELCGNTVLNTIVRSRVMQPAAEPGVWGPSGNFPTISMVLDNMFDPKIQLGHYLAWHRVFYKSALEGLGCAGQAIFMSGGAGIGKTLNSTKIVGGTVGGFADGSKYVTGQDNFGGELFEKPLICIDDEVVSSSDNVKTKMEAILKQLVANVFQRVHNKFQKAGVTEYYGRAIFTTNLDLVALRMTPTLSEGMKQKVNLYRCAMKADRPDLIFPPDRELARMIETELPSYCRFLLDYEIPTEYLGDARFTIKAYHDPSLRERSFQSTRASTFAELLVELLVTFFKDHPEAVSYVATATQLTREILSNPLNQEILRTLRSEQVNRYLEQLQRDGRFSCRTKDACYGTRRWEFDRLKDEPMPPLTNGTRFD